MLPSKNDNFPQVHSQCTHGAGITGVSFSPDNSTIATCSKDSTVKFWSAVDYSLQGQVTIASQGLSLSYAPDGSKLAVSVYGKGVGLALTPLLTPK
jgi:WD40 repeat protein